MNTIPGGAYQDAAGNWRDANGLPLSQAQIKEAQRLASEQAKRLQDPPTPGVVTAAQLLDILAQQRATPAPEPQVADNKPDNKAPTP